MTNQKPNQSESPVRITRRCLIGTGIVSGLELALDDTHQICISPGKGLTSDGKYTEVYTTMLFSFYRDYLPDAPYDFFKKKNGEVLPLWELVNEDDFIEGDQPLSPQYDRESRNPFLKDKVVLLFLDEKEEQAPDPDGSNEETSDKNNQQENENPVLYHQRFLLMRRDDLLQQLNIDRLATHIVWQRLEDDEDYIYSDIYNPEDDRPRAKDINKALNPALRLPEIPLRRFGFSKGDPYDCPPEGVDQSVFPELMSLDDIYEGYRPAIDEAIGDLDAALRRLYDLFKPVLTKYPVWDILATLDALCDKWEAYKRKNQSDDISTHHKEYIQYFYDWMRDLLKAYHELRKMLIDFTFISITDANDFPLHLLLGEPLREEITNIPRPFRQHFKQPPVYNGQADRLQAIRLYFWRILVMIKNFYLPGYIDPPKMDFCNTPLEEPEEELNFEQLKVTPGKYYDNLLEEQTMPYYYFPIARHRFSLHHFWNYERTRNSSNDQILSYHANDKEDSYTDQLHVIRPLHYNIDTYSFLRIEGHIAQPLLDYSEEGENVMGVLNHLHYIKQKYNLDFGIIALPISQEHPLSYTYEERFGPPDSFQSFHPPHLGMEHLAGVQKGGTFVIIYDLERIVIADFCLPYQCCKYCLCGWITDCLNDQVIRNISVSISKSDDPEERIPVEIDETGYFQKCLPTGAYILNISDMSDFPRFETYESNVNLDGDLIFNIKLINKYGIIRGNIINNLDLNLEGATVLLSSPELSESRQSEITNETFRFEDIPVGEVKLQIIGSNGEIIPNVERELEVLPCQVTELDWVLEPDVVFAGKPKSVTEADFKTSKEKLLSKVGKAPEGQEDDLTKIKGIGPKTKEILNKNGITSFVQLSKMTKELYYMLNPPIPLPEGPHESWAKEAREKIKNK